ncbi:P-loop containing nucleoside triphosphate hydrolase protein [Lasiosphaeris hirsuta]|uniref:P-loop containing nucleoside triphosphate hydrolase protein n=1 Tax=Lasiosphaeris hirsuta TaxID=260670 RepID=A0AA40E1R7_9PEZI|nr:P-loop containing nucleoside triphosphate hydrolase protein [Lasiosphaeris hirsuta]
MLRNNKTPVSVLQKTYDESYLTCSTAVYYEGQGNEDEAMRCWKLALDQIYEHHANRVAPNYTPRSETEKALMDSLRRLELQCKERIDLLEALRLSRRDVSQSSPPSPQDKPTGSSPEPQDTQPPEKGWIGGGTIPAVKYMELSRPALPKRPSMPTRSSREQLGNREAPASNSEAAPLSSPLASPPSLPPFEEKVPKSASPERHTMRTTLRTGRLGDKSSKSISRRPAPKPVDGPGASKAASLAWSVLGQRDKSVQGSSSSHVTTKLPSDPQKSLERPRRSLETSLKQWDSHTRRLVTPGSRSPSKNFDEQPSSDLETGTPRRSTDYPSPGPPPLSVSAAANALSFMNLRENASQQRQEREQLVRQKTAPPRTPQAMIPRRDAETERPEDLAQRILGRKMSSDSNILSRRPIGQGFSTGRGNTRPTKSADTTRPLTERRESRVEERLSSSSVEESSIESRTRSARRGHKGGRTDSPLVADVAVRVPESSSEDEDSRIMGTWNRRKAAILKRLPPGVDEHAAKQILNEIVIQGDEVHWSDIAGLDIAKNALREAVVYPFLRPDLFMGLREPARGMLLFGPPGTGKTMLARAVATESKSTFFSISASSLTSKYLGESEKLVRALFVLAKVLAPSIIFVDEIDSLLSQRSGSGENEATRRIKTEFLIQWSDLQRAAVGREVGEKDRERGDANRVLVLAATNLPWAIDEAARRRFVRRQYIPLPEAETRAVQIKTLLSQQKHTLTDADISVLIGLTDGFSGSDITALAKDAAMGPLRSLGEALLHMTMDEIRPIGLPDFIASLTTIRPSVSKSSLRQYEDWASEFGERGG